MNIMLERIYPYLRKKTASILNYLHHHRFQNVLSISFAMVLVIGVGAVVLLSFLRYSQVFETVVREKNIQILDQTNQYMDSYIRNMMKISDSLYYQVIKEKDFEKESMDEEMKLFYNSNQDKLVSIALFDSYGNIVNAVPFNELKQDVDVRRQQWFESADSMIENLYFSTPHVQNIFENEIDHPWVVSLSRSVEIMKGKKMERGVLLLDMNFNGIEQVCESVSLGADSYMYLMDKDGEIIFHPRQQLIYAGIEKENSAQMLPYDDGSHTETFEGVKRIVTIKTVGYTGWRLVAVTPISDLSHQYLQIQEFALFIFLFGTLGLIFMTKLVSAKIADPIQQLELTMNAIADGNLDLSIEANGSYEIEHLGESLNTMVQQMKKLMAEAIEKETQKRKTELDALQTQINPHFLYNTLDSIIWMIENERYDGAIHMLSALARFFRLSLSKGKNIILVKDEVEHARYYLEIQQVRYRNKFQYAFEIDPAVENMATLKFILQPMIENAIYHGMQYMDGDDDGMITISAYRKDQDLYLEVKDNGAGMTPKELGELFSNHKKEKSKGSGIGMKNVNMRIRLYFGEAYGVSVYSEPDEGTTVVIHMPIRTLKELEHEGKML